MAPINFENDFKEKLDKRTIAPSENAWNTLAERLDTEEKTANNKGFWWVGIAASIVGILFIATQFFSNDVEVNIPEVVNTEETVEHPEKTIVTKPNSEVAIENSDKENNDKEGNNPILNKTEKYQEASSTHIAQEQTTQTINKERDIEEHKSIEAVSFETKKAQEVADVIFSLSEKESGISDASIDSLLKAAQRDILLSRMKNKDQISIDAALLLQEVEFELDESFREKVFKAFKSSYGSIKTAIAQRND
ncbi:hypothetical protein [Hyunsoonleella pacifica]|uniref:Uncharacterized protein n=1 Tax=Hyunsoonleella pacifica TaxID=1080224 RepID=A0A4Q9FM08_9FLAO|nr:hypothetical protein [Hyunsoonleella pacifica]TBN14664.1 hypothetical protein EYD46_13940 [Hyunsoonleella pacifica]GGD15644.1 hypothetical protein GCM10011368_17040 [Hyunsoonleella pacifica]